VEKNKEITKHIWPKAKQRGRKKEAQPEMQTWANPQLHGNPDPANNLPSEGWAEGASPSAPAP